MAWRRDLALVCGALVVAGLGLIVAQRRSPARAQGSEAKLIVYWEENFEGPGLEITGTVVDLPVVSDEAANTFDWNDQVRSVIVVAGTWRLYQHGRMNTELDDTPVAELDVSAKAPRSGWSCLVSATSGGPLKIPSVRAGGFEEDVSSIELVSGESLPDWAVFGRGGK